MTETALIVGVGPGLGRALALCFAGSGLGVAVAARDQAKLDPLAEELAGLGVSAHAYGCDVTRESDVGGLFQQVGDDLGGPGLVVFNAGAFVRKGIIETTSEEFERCWRVGCLGGFHVGQAAARAMMAKGKGTIVFTSATASLRGGAGFHNLAVPKFGLRALAQSMARELGPKGIHVARVIIDGQIMSENHDPASRPPDAFLDAAAIAANYLMIHRQQRSAWTQELDLRPWVEKF